MGTDYACVQVAASQVFAWKSDDARKGEIDRLRQKVIVMIGSRSRIVHRPMPQDDPRQGRPDIGQAEELLNWRPTVMLTEGLRQTISYFAKLHERRRIRESRSIVAPAVLTEVENARTVAMP